MKHMSRTDLAIPFLTRNQTPQESIPDQILNNYIDWLQENDFFDKNGWQRNKTLPNGTTIEPPTLQQWTDNNYEKTEIYEQHLKETDQTTTTTNNQPTKTINEI